jgi:transposase
VSAEQSMRPIALVHKNYLFIGSEGSGKSAPIACTLIETAKLSGVDPQAWISDVLAKRRGARDHQARRAHAVTLR